MAVRCGLSRLGPRGIGALLVIAAVAGCGAGGSGAPDSTRAKVHQRQALRVALTATAPRTQSAARKRPSAVKLTVEVNGDLLIHSPVWERAFADGHGNYDFSPMLREITPFIKSADLAICHMETPMTPRAPAGYPVFNTPTQLAGAIRKSGWRICDTASNHSVDQGQYGIDQTGRALDRAGILHTGSFGSSAAQNRTLIVTVKGVKVAFLAYTEMTNGIPLPHPWSVNLAHVAAVEAKPPGWRASGAPRW